MKCERDLPFGERLERQPLMAFIDVLTKEVVLGTGSPFFSSYLRPELNALQIWDPRTENLLGQVIYLPDSKVTYACHVVVRPMHLEPFLASFGKYFAECMAQTFRFRQAYARASKHATTLLRFHYTQTQDASNRTPDSCSRLFPYPIFPVEVDESLCTVLTNNPAPFYNPLQDYNL